MPEAMRDIVARLRSGGAGDAFHEIESCAHAPGRSVWESVSAFANARGGILVFGLDAENGFSPLKGFSPDDLADAFAAGMADGGPAAALVNAPQYDMRREDFEGAPAIVVEVRELDVRLKPCFLAENGLQNGSYKRVGSENVKLTPVEIHELKSAAFPNDAEIETVVEADLDDLDMALIGRMIERRRKKSPRALRGAETQSAQLERLNIIDKKGNVKLMGLLAAGFYPQQFFPKLVVEVSVHEGASPRPVERIVCDGALPEMVDAALEALSRILGRRFATKGRRYSDEWEIPRKALREAIANAVVHREYGRYFLGCPVSVEVYPHKVVVKSPGGLWGGKSADAMDDGASRCRNARLMQIMESSLLASDGACVVEGHGSGVAAMFGEADGCGLARPEFDVSPDSFQVTFARPAERRGRTSARTLPYRQDALFADVSSERNATGEGVLNDARVLSDAVEDENEYTGRLAGEVAFERGAGTRTAAAFGGNVRESRERQEVAAGSIEGRIVALLETRNEPIAARDIADGLGIEMSVLRYRMKKLIDAGAVVATAAPTSKKRRYVLAEASDASAPSLT